ncbi:hypothetical protein ACWDA7_49215, partial [Streptomyces sp. NPDC001156]
PCLSNKLIYQDVPLRHSPGLDLHLNTQTQRCCLSCPLCDLELNGPEEIKASGADITKAVLPSNTAVSWGATPPAAVDIHDTHAG